MLFRKLFLLLVPVFLLFSQTACAGDSTAYSKTGLKPEPQHQTVFQTTLQLVATYHYAKPRINDEFSSQALDNYLKHLDPSRVYFLQSDIASFEKYRNTLDEAVFEGGPDMAFDIFNVYRERLNDRIDFALTLLKDSFDFNQQDSFEIDREKSSWCVDYREMDQLWRNKVKYECLGIALTDKPFTFYAETIRKRYENLRKFSAKTKSEDVFQLFMNSILELADPHTNYFSPRSAEDFKQAMTLSLEGIGATLRTENEYTKVHEIVKGGPADKSKKIHAGDRIIGVAQGKDSEMVNVIDWRIDDVVAIIRGKKGTLVRLEIIPANEPNKTTVIEIVRDKIVLEDQSAKSSIRTITRKGKKYKIGVITLPTFYIDFAAAQRGDPNFKSTTRDVKRLITELKKEKISGLIIDLRYNGGGSLKEAVDLTGLFIPKGPVVQVKDQAENVRSEVDYDEQVFYNGPLVVLVNRQSASASEIFSAAIQDYKRGLVIGERTYGKGTVQEQVDLNQYKKNAWDKKFGQVNLTIAKFYRINGSTTQHLGVTPDIQLPGIYDDAKFGEDASPFALKSDQINNTHYDVISFEGLKLPELIQQAEGRLKSNVEYAYLLQDIHDYKTIDARRYQTLNKEKWKTETDEQDKRKKVREEERKKRTGTDTHPYDLIRTLGEEAIADMLNNTAKR
ncbi:MAG: carboxy terminal-processing peptidase [Bacteroidia bacterium]|jgi:carboxyl-terminal processing protease